MKYYNTLLCFILEIGLILSHFDIESFQDNWWKVIFLRKFSIFTFYGLSTLFLLISTYKRMEINNISELQNYLKSDGFNFANFQILTSKTPPKAFNEECILGVDEAGRGPVLGPMVYAVSYVPKNKISDMERIGCADSKTLTEKKREDIFLVICNSASYMGWTADVISPNFISNKMLKRSKISLNEIAEDATILLIKSVLDKGINVTEIFVDTVGVPEKYEEKLSKTFPGRKVTVAKKADSIYPIVSAASICAKVIRDLVIHNWKFSEDVSFQTEEIGSGYPNDPLTKSFLKNNVDEVFGFPNLVRFSWSTASKILEDSNVAASVEWEDEEVSPAKSIINFLKPENESSALEMKHNFFKKNNLANRFRKCEAWTIARDLISQNFK